jgi:hypothetical protein
MKLLITLLAIFCISSLNAQTTLACGKNNVTVTGQKISSTKYIGSDKKSKSIFNYYYELRTDSLVVWEEFINDYEAVESITVSAIAKKDISTKTLPYLDLFPGSEYEKPVQRIYITCEESDCIQATGYYNWAEPGTETHNTNGFYQIDGSDKKLHQELLTKILDWLKK